MRVLLVEDDLRVGEALRRFLQKQDIDCDWVTTGAQALAGELTADAVVLDLNLPDGDGVDVCRYLRARSTAPIVITSGRSTVADRIRGLDSGADDYLVKPFSGAELVARLGAIRRRTVVAGATTPLIEHAGLRIDRLEGRVTLAGRPVVLTPSELIVLAAIAERAGGLCTHDEIETALGTPGWPASRSSVETHMSNLRAKLRPASVLVNVRGRGYRLAAPEGASRVPAVNEPARSPGAGRALL